MTDRLPPADAILAVDIGNTRIGMACWDDDGLHDAQHVSVHEPDAWGATLETLWGQLQGREYRAVVISSVHPQHGMRFADLASEVCDVDPLRVRDDLPFPMAVRVDSLAEIGVDRICSAAAAFEHIQGACAIASFGTATTIDCVSAEGVYLGGTILPGLQTACDALHDATAALPQVEIGSPRGVFGRNTHDAIINGVVFSAVGGLREIVERFATELGAWPQLVITGGNAPIIAEQADFIDSYVPNLCLMGVALAYRRAPKQV